MLKFKRLMLNVKVHKRQHYYIVSLLQPINLLWSSLHALSTN